MKDKIVVAVLGNRNSGKSHTWNALFGAPVRTGKEIRRLHITRSEYVEVFLVSGSPEERHVYVGQIIGEQSPRMVLCSMQYRREVIQTIDYFCDSGYSLFLQWLNPGFSDQTPEQDALGLMDQLLSRGATISMRDGRANSASRVSELRDFISGWARSRGLINCLDSQLVSSH